MDTILDIDFIEFYVGNAFMTANYYQIVFGFKLIAFKPSKNGDIDIVSYVVSQGDIKLVFTSSTRPNSVISKHVFKHGDSVKKVAFTISNFALTWEMMEKKKAVIAQKPIVLQDEQGKVKYFEIKLYGDVTHVFIDRQSYSGVFLPNYSATLNSYKSLPVGLTSIDHFTGNVEHGKMDYWIDYYVQKLDFSLMLYYDDNDIYNEYSAMMSKVALSNSGIKCPISQPVNQIKQSQIQEFLNFNKGAGIQHIAINSEDIIKTVLELQKRGVEFLKVPLNYYNELADKIDISSYDINDLKSTNVMIDDDENGSLLQAFTKPLSDRPTFFIEFIQRKGSTSFGKNNVKALYNALVAEQQSRAK
jgi:4-hydroxyphenylpyruvate dioxygenase